MLKWLGFGTKIREHIKILFIDANVRVAINGSLSPQFPLQKSICQGCPLASFIFVLAIDSLGYLFQHAHASKLIHGISFPCNVKVLNSHYVGDRMLFIKNLADEVTHTLDVLDLFCTISGSKLAMNKIEFIMTHPSPHPLVSLLNGMKLNMV